MTDLERYRSVQFEWAIVAARKYAYDSRGRLSQLTERMGPVSESRRSFTSVSPFAARRRIATSIDRTSNGG